MKMSKMNSLHSKKNGVGAEEKCNGNFLVAPTPFQKKLRFIF
jgi:hypothetical protein